MVYRRSHAFAARRLAQFEHFVIFAALDEKTL